MSTRKLVSAVSWLSLGNVMVKALSLVTMPILTRYLSPDAYGVAALVGTLISLSSVIGLMGIDMGYSRHVFSGQWGSSVEIEAFCWRWVMVAAMATALLAGCLWWFVAEWHSVSRGYAGFVIAGVFFSALMAMAQTRARLANRYLQLAWVQFGTGCLAAVASISIALLWRQDAWPLLVAMIIGYALPVLLLGVPTRTTLLAPSCMTPVARRSVLSTGLAGVITAPAYWALSSSDRWFLAAYQDSAAVGVYSIGFTVGTIGAVVSTAITAAWLPELSRDEAAVGGNLESRKRDMTQVLFAALLIVAVGVSASGGDIIRALADRRFHAAADVVPWLAAGMLFYGIMHVGNALLVMRAKLHFAALAWLVALAVSVALNWWLIPMLGALGAAMAQAVSFCVVMVLVWVAVLRVDPLPLNWRRLVPGMVLAAFAAIEMQWAWLDNPWYSLLAKLPVGVAFAIICLWVVSPNALHAGWRNLKGVA